MASSFIRASVAFPAASLMVGASLLAAGGASAAFAETCPTGSTLVTAGVCEVVFTSTPSGVWTPPAGVTKIEALLVGGGGAAGGANEYGGGGGDVQLVDLAPTGDVTVIVGQGRLAEVGAGDLTIYDTSVTQGGNTYSALAGESGSGSYGGTSGNGIESFGDGGAGAGDTTNTEAGGPGLVVADLTLDSSSLFAGDTTCYSGGGANDGAETTCGGGTIPIPTSQLNPGDLVPMTLPRANSGAGGGGSRNANFPGVEVIAQDGADGVVIIRYAGATLPDTGRANLSTMAWTAAGALALGAGAVGLAVRANSRRRH